MINQLVQPKDTKQRLILIILTLILMVMGVIVGFYIQQVSDPYIHEVLSLNGDSSNGQAIFAINCAGCHGLDADGNVGPDLRQVHKRKSKISLIHQVISGNTPPMPKFQPSSQEMADLLNYLETL